MRCEYAGKEKGPAVTACISDDHISLDVLPDLGIPEGAWMKDGWELTPLVQPPTVSFFFNESSVNTFVCPLLLKLQKATLDSYEEGKLVPHFALTLKLKDTTSPQSLVQQIAFTGLQQSTSFTLLREPRSMNEKFD